MSIASRIEAINQHLLDDYSVLELGGADLTNVDKNIFNLKPQWQDRLKYYLANGTDTLWNNWEKVNGTGETLSLSPTIKGKMKVDLKGNTYQYSTTGKNLFNVFDKNNQFTTDNEGWITATINNSSGSGTVFSNFNVNYSNLISTDTNYAILLEVKSLSGSGRLTVNEGNNSQFSNTSAKYFSELSANTTYKYIVRTRASFEDTTLMLRGYMFCVAGESGSITFRISILANTSITPETITYEPYTGGIASPNPDYPQDIQVVSGNNSIDVSNGDNTESATYPISLGNIELCKIGTYQDKIAKSTGKNLFDISAITENTWMDEWGQTGSSSVTNLSDYIEIKENTQFKLSYNYNTLLNNTQRGICFYNESKTFISGVLYNSIDKQISFTTPNNAKYVRFAYDKNCFDIMINEGTTALPYEPYGTSWYLNKQIGKVVLDGSESWQRYGAYGSAYLYYVDNETDGLINGTLNNVGEGLCNYALWTHIADNTATPPYVRFQYNNGKRLYVGISNDLTIENFKSMLNTENMVVCYAISPTYTPITDTNLLSQLEALAYSYDEQTNISQVNDDMPFVLDITALKEMS